MNNYKKLTEIAIHDKSNENILKKEIIYKSNEEIDISDKNYKNNILLESNLKKENEIIVKNLQIMKAK